MLTFLDDTQVAVNGLDEILTQLHAEGRQVDEGTAGEIIHRLEEAKNYIPSSARVRRDYAYVLLKEYRSFLKRLAEDSGESKRQTEQNTRNGLTRNGKIM